MTAVTCGGEHQQPIRQKRVMMTSTWQDDEVFLLQAEHKAALQEDAANKIKLATLLEAGNAMRERLMSLRALSIEADMRGNAEGYINASTLFTNDDAAALAAWEQVTK
jgi:hypothetical protein